MILRKFLDRLKTQMPEREAYRQIVVQARQPSFYAELGVPDTVTGRFDLISLHAFLLFERLQGTDDERNAVFAQAVFDEMFQDMDHNLREMGVGDLSVGKKVRKMAEVFYGRAEAYRAALAESDPEQLKDAFQRNIFEGKASLAALQALYDYVVQAREDLTAQEAARLRKGLITFPPAPQITE